MVMTRLRNSFGRNNAKATKTIQLPTVERNKTPFQIVDPSHAYKANADYFSRNALNFINGASLGSGYYYTEQQLLGAYYSSVYMFAALRRVANLISRVKIVAEEKNEHGEWVRSKNGHPLNELFAKDGSRTLQTMYLNFAIYGATAVLKTRSRKAIYEAQNGNPIYRFDEGAVSGLYTLDKPLWDIDEAYQYGEVRGFYVNRIAPNEFLDDAVASNYLQRDEVVYYTDWNPENPNRGRSLVATAIHEATANAAIAQWMAEYFTRGAMPMLIVTMDEEEPQLITDADLMKYKRQFEEYQQGLNASLRTYFLDRKVAVEQIGISADEVGASDLNETALEGISSVVGIDRKLIVTTDSGAYAEQVQLVKSAWENTIIPLAEQFITAFNRDIGIDTDYVRLVADLSHIRELEADRDEKSGTEISIFEAGLQSYNETRTRIGMPPIKELEGFLSIDGQLQHLQHVMLDSQVPPQKLKEYAMELYEADMIVKSRALKMLGLDLPVGHKDGYKSEIENYNDLIKDLWDYDLLKRSEIMTLFGYPVPSDLEDGYKSELERGADYADYITELWSDNLLTRSQVIKLLNLNIELPSTFVDGYQDDISERQDKVTSLYSDNLITKRQALERLDLPIPAKFIDGYADEIDRFLDIKFESKQNERDFYMELWSDNLITKSELMKALGLPIPENMIDGFNNEVEGKTDQALEEKQNYRDYIFDLYDKNLIPKSGVTKELKIPYVPENTPDGYNAEVETYIDAIAEAKTDKVLIDLGLKEEEPATEGGEEEAAKTYRQYTPYASIPTLDEGLDAFKDIEPMSDVLLDAGVLKPNKNDNRRPFQKIPTRYDKYDVLPDDIRSKVLQRKNELDMADSEKENNERVVDKPVTRSDESITRKVTKKETVKPRKTDKVMSYVMGDTKADDDMFFEYYVPSRDDSAYGQNRGLEETIENRLQEKNNWEDLVSYYGDYVDVIDVRNNTAKVDETTKYMGDEMIEITSNCDLYANIWLPNNPTIKALQSHIIGQVSAAMRHSGQHYRIMPVPAKDFHITISTARNVDAKTAERLYDLLPSRYEQPIIECVDFNIFPSEERLPLYIEVAHNETLDSIFYNINTHMSSLGIEIMDHYRIGDWNPHITIAYIEATNPRDIMNSALQANVTVENAFTATELRLMRDKYQTEHYIPLSVKRTYDNQKEIEEQINLIHHWRYNIPRNERNVSFEDMWKPVVMEIIPYVVDAMSSNAPKISTSIFNILSDAIRTKKITPEKSEVKIRDMIKSMQNDRISEMRAWRKVAIKNPRRALEFENIHIDDITSQKIKSILSSIETNNKNQKDIAYHAFSEYIGE